MDAQKQEHLCPLHAGFLAILPRIENHGKFYFRDGKDESRREEAVAEMVALAWKAYVRLVARGKNVHEFVSTFSHYLARSVQNGRRLCGQQRSCDAMAPQAQRDAHRVAASRCSMPLIEALTDNSITPPDQQAAFRIDFDCWLGTRTRRDRQLVNQLMMGEKTGDVARDFGLSSARVSQLRREYCADWQCFQGDLVCEVGEGQGGVVLSELTNDLASITVDKILAEWA